MNTKKYTNNLQKSSGLFLQLGLVLTLFTTYLALELKTEQRTVHDIQYKSDTEKPYEFVSIERFRIEERIVKKTKSIPKKQVSSTFIVDDIPTQKDNTPPFEAPDPDKGNPDILEGLVKVEKLDDFVENVPYTNVQEVPVFPGCEKVKKSKKRACFEKKLHKFIQRKFNSELVNQLGLSSGVQKIYVQFVISKTGKIEVLGAKAPHKRLMIEGKRVVNKLPKMVPGKQNGEAVNVKYMLPIVFNVE